jgi:hypothetical protein
MVNITIVGPGVYGTRIASKYKKFETAELRAVVGRHKPKTKVFLGVPFFGSAATWRKEFGTPGNKDVFDICVHNDTLICVVEDFIKIGAKNFILPKPIALNKSDLLQIRKLISKHKLKVLVASQWHYSGLVKEIGDFVSKNKSKISRVEVVFSRTFESARKNSFTPSTAFLPHILQILINTKLFQDKSILKILNWSDNKINVRYYGKTEVRIESDLTTKEKQETLSIFLVGKKTPSLTANFSGILGRDGFVVYPSITINGKNKQVEEDILEKMVEASLEYFDKTTKNNKILTISKYLPVATEEVRIIEQASNLVVVVGAGIFGILSALNIAKNGHNVVILEKGSEIITGASLVNQCRVHMGYHYPRDEKTAIDSHEAKILFDKVFGRAIIKNLKNHYLIAKEGSLTNPKDFLSFCKKLNLPYVKAWPVNTKISMEKIALSLMVPEPIFDANVIREILYKKINETSNVSIFKSANVTAIKKTKEGYSVTYELDDAKEIVHCAAVVNATYGNINYINNMAGFSIDNYQYELCEVPIARTPWKNTGWAIMDGPFFGIMPFGFSKNHLLYDVELSVLERVVGKFPKFKHDIAYYDDNKRRLNRFNKLKKKWLPYAPEVEKCRSLSSMYATRIVLPKREKTDSRPTMIKELAPGFWQMFSGKITTSVPQTIELAEIVHNYLNKNK